jgi:hypothetical protein
VVTISRKSLRRVHHLRYQETARSCWLMRNDESTIWHLAWHSWASGGSPCAAALPAIAKHDTHLMQVL